MARVSTRFLYNKPNRCLSKTYWHLLFVTGLGLNVIGGLINYQCCYALGSLEITFRLLSSNCTALLTNSWLATRHAFCGKIIWAPPEFPTIIKSLGVRSSHCADCCICFGSSTRVYDSFLIHIAAILQRSWCFNVGQCTAEVVAWVRTSWTETERTLTRAPRFFDSRVDI